MNPFFGGGGMNPGFPFQNPTGNFWMGIYNNNNMMNNNNNMPQANDKLNAIFKMTNGKIINVQIDYDKTIGDLICLFLKKMGSEELIGNEKDICFLNNATKLRYNDTRKVSEVFRLSNPTIMVNDVKNLIGAI